MIFVTVGTQKFQFDRLIKGIDKVVECKATDEDVFIQKGYCTYIPQYCAYKDFLSKDEFEKKISDCSLLITHSGVATIINGIKHKKPIIVMPRLAKYKEHVDNHQIQIAESFAAQNLVLKCYDEDNFIRLINEAKTHKFDAYVSQRETMLSTIRDYINKL